MREKNAEGYSNRTWNGAGTQQILATVLRTCWQQGKDAFEQFATLLYYALRSQ